jgi:hypothetical protein
MVPTLITSFAPTLSPSPLSHSGEAVTETDNSKSEIGYLILLVSACYIDHIEKSINFNEFFVINQKKTFLIHLGE